MKPSELYALPPLLVQYDFDNVLEALTQTYCEDGSPLRFFQDIHNSPSEFLRELEITIEKEQRLKTHFHMKIYEDENVAELSSIFFDNIPFMVIKKFGYENYHYYTYVTDSTVFNSFTDYVKSHTDIKNSPVATCDPNETIDNLSEVEGYQLHQLYNYSQQNDYQVGDLVWAYVPVKEHDKEDSYIVTAVKITKISPFDIYETYEGEQIHRVWKNGEMIYSPHHKKSFYSAVLNKALILGKTKDLDIPENSVENLSDEDGLLNPYYEGPSLQDLYNIYNKKNKLKNKP